jgi:tRNA modification GTPase
LLLTFPGPASATGEDIVEFHGHGGRAIVARLTAALTAIDGVRLAEPGEFARRALGNGRIDLTEADGLADLLAAETEVQRRVALARAEGAIRQRVERWRTALLDLSAMAEVAIDYPDEEDGVAAPDPGPALAALSADIREQLSGPRLEPLRDGFRVVLAGPPNAGKSSLINALSGTDRAIVTPIAGTTRDTIEVPMAIDGLPIVLVDTAGLRDGGDDIEKMGIARAERELARADLVLWLGDDEPEQGDCAVILVSPKSDIRAPEAGRVAVSAITADGLDALRIRIGSSLVDRTPTPAQVAFSAREIAELEKVVAALERAHDASPIFQAEEFRFARTALDRIVGRTGLEDVLDTIFGRFCLGK